LAKGTADYEAKEADLSKALSSLDRAIKTLESSQPTKASLLKIDQSVKNGLALAEAMKLVDEGPKWSSVAALLQQHAKVDPSDPDYKFHSQGIVDILKKLLDEFTTKKADTDSDWSNTKKTLEDTIDKLTKELDLNSKIRDSLKVDIDKMVAEAADIRGKLVEATAQLQDDEAYMKELTQLCEVRSKDWDQRAQMRAGELEALTQALNVMTEKVKAADEEANKRALLLLQKQVPSPSAQLKVNKSVMLHGNASIQANTSNLTLGNSSRKQINVPSSHAGISFLQSSAIGSLSGRHTELALEVLRSEGNRIHSVTLSTLAMRIAADPFAKVKTLIQNLIERLIQEATQEATKKGFCDKALGDAKQERDFRYAEVKKLSASVQTLHAKEEALELEIDDLNTSVADLNSALTEATTDRDAEKQDNLKAVKTAKDGLKAVLEALNILKDFYRKAARAKVLLQRRATPLQDDTQGPGFSGAYKGHQDGSKGIIGLLEVIKSDFERTIKSVTGSEEQAASEFAKFSQTTSKDISGKATKKEMDVEHLSATKNTLTAETEDLQTNMDLMDEALKELQKHKAMCVDHGMTYEERKTKREEEMAALKKALCTLDTEGVEEGC